MYRGYYINLDRNSRRRTAITENLNSIGLGHIYQRFPAVDGNAAAHEHPSPLRPGALGLWLTHEKILHANLGSDQHLHILEDDAILANSAADALPALLKHADANVPGWDLIFTNMLLPLKQKLFHAILNQWEAYRKTGEILLLNLKGLYRAHSTSFFVNKRSIDKYLCLISGGWSRGMPIDVQQRVLINESKLKAAVCVPFLSSTSPHSNDSDIRGQLDASRRVYRCYSRALFIDADHAELIRELRQHLAGAKVPPLAEIYLGAVAFSLSDKFEKF